MDMFKNKYLIIGGIVGLMGLAGIGWWVWSSQNKSLSTQNPSGVRGAQTGQFLSQTSDPNSISLNRTQPTSKTSSGLSVAPHSAANNLGQINPNSDGSSNPTNNKSSAPSPFDPATFAQYEKHKDENAALFGEVQIGTGDELTAGKKAAVYYKGWLTNGQLFDGSRPGKDGKLEPFVFEMGAQQVIPGWEQGLLGMKVGGTRLVIVPPAVGYGATGQGSIPPNAVLIFQVQLLAVQ